MPPWPIWRMIVKRSTVAPFPAPEPFAPPDGDG